MDKVNFLKLTKFIIIMKLGKNEKKILISLLQKYIEGEKYAYFFEGKSISILAEEIYDEPIREEYPFIYTCALLNKVKSSLSRSLNTLWKKDLVFKGKPIYNRYWKKKGGYMIKDLEAINLYKYNISYDNKIIDWAPEFQQEPDKQIDWLPKWARLPSKTKIWWVLTEKGREIGENLKRCLK